MQARFRRGFTLMELLIVVGVMAILAAILWPVLAAAREEGHRTTCLANLRQIGLAHQLYVQDYDEVLPTWYSMAIRGFVMWPEFMRPYVQDPRILDQEFSPPAERARTEWLADYVMLTWGPGGTGTAQNPYWRWPGSLLNSATGGRPMTLFDVRRPAETLQFADGFTGRTISYPLWRHGNGIMNGAFLDGHAHAISSEAYDQKDQDAQGYFYHLATADR